jgi:hypothetical protein
MLQGRVTSLKEKLEQVSKSEAAWEHKFKMADTELTRAKQGTVTIRRLYILLKALCVYGTVFQHELGHNRRHIKSFVKFLDLCLFTALP